MLHENVGISAIQVYFPPRCVEQVLFETEQNCAGKYTKGLGQERMAYTGFPPFFGYLPTLYIPALFSVF